jgi:hypothetical protein
MGFLRTLERARDKFFWYNLVADVKRYVRECLPCQKRKWQGQMLAPLGEFPPVSFPLERVGVDLIELPLSYSGNKYCLTIVDHLTSYAKAYPIPDKTAETVAKAFIQFVSENSCPLNIVSDRGSEWINNIFQQVVKTLKIKLNLTTAYHPMANGKTERMNGVIKTCLSHVSSTDQLTWDESIPHVILAINTAYQTSIGDIPFFLFHGRDAQLPYEDLLCEQPINYATDENYAADMTLRLTSAFREVRKKIKIAHDRSAQNYDRKASVKEILPGSMVLLRNESGRNDTRQPNNWPTRFIGPYRVLERKDNNAVIKGIYSDQVTQTVHVNRLKVAYLRPDEAYPFNNVSVPSCPKLPSPQRAVTPDPVAIPVVTPRYNLRSRKIP